MIASSLSDHTRRPYPKRAGARCQRLKATVVEVDERCSPRRLGTNVMRTRIFSGRWRWSARTPALFRRSLSVVVEALRSLREAPLRYLPLAVTRPAAHTRSVSLSVCEESLRRRTLMQPRARAEPAQPATVIFVFCLICAPLWAVIVVGITSGLAHTSPYAASAECGPIGRLSEKLDTGTSGRVAKLEIVIPRLMSVLPTRITRTPLPS